jgi:hypothetical protein
LSLNRERTYTLGKAALRIALVMSFRHSLIQALASSFVALLLAPLAAANHFGHRLLAMKR